MSEHPIHLLSVVGTRPNFMKVAPIIAALDGREGCFSHTLVHTGQHYDRGMSQVFFEQLGVGEPDYDLEVGSGAHGAQTAKVMTRLEPLLEDLRPDAVLVPGDVNSTLAAALVASKMGIRVAHIEAGLRSFDRTMPEELNRILTDAVSDLLFTHSPEARGHLLAEGRPGDAIHEVGNTMIDTLVAMQPRIQEIAAPAQHGLSERGYVVVTLHRPALTDGDMLPVVLEQIQRLADFLPVVFPIHPRTRARIAERGLEFRHPGVRLLDPLGYVEFLGLVSSAAAVLTDSGGIQEETTYLGVPCFTLRDNTERPVTVTHGTNVLLGLAPQRIEELPEMIESRIGMAFEVPEGWDGNASGRIVEVLERLREPIAA